MGLLKELIFSVGKQHGAKQPTQDAKAWEALLLTHHPLPRRRSGGFVSPLAEYAMGAGADLPCPHFRGLGSPSQHQEHNSGSAIIMAKQYSENYSVISKYNSSSFRNAEDWRLFCSRENIPYQGKVKRKATIPKKRQKIKSHELLLVQRRQFLSAHPRTTRLYGVLHNSQLWTHLFYPPHYNVSVCC